MSSELRSRALLGALLLAVLLRAEYLRELLQTPFGHHVVLDGVFYEQAARHILAGQPLAADPGCFRAPLYPFFLAAVRFFFPEGLLAPRLVQMLLGLVTVVLVRGIALRTHGVRVANVAAFLAAGYGMFIYHEAELLGVALGVTLNTAATLLLLEGGRRESLRWIAAGGLTLGLTAITHGTALVLAPVAFFWLLAIGWRGPRGRLAVRLLVLTASVTLPVSLATLKNWMSTGDFILVATQGGINFYVGNNGEADGRTSLVPGTMEEEYLTGGEYRDLFEVAAERIAWRESGRTLSPSEINAYWMDRAKRWMRENPGDAVRLLLRKGLLVWTGLENSNNRDLEDQGRRFTPILAVFLRELAFLMPFAILGLLLWRGSPRESALVIAFILVYAATIAAFFVCSRFRQPLTALLLPYAAAGAVGFLDRVRHARENPRAMATAALLLAALFAVTNQNLMDRIGVLDLSLPNAPFHRYNLAVMMEQDGDLEGAAREYRAAALLHPEDARIPMNLAGLLWRQGRREEADEVLERLLRTAPGFAGKVRWMQGMWAVQDRDWGTAAQRFAEVVRLDPADEGARFVLASALLSTGRFAEAAEQYERILGAGSKQEAVVRRNLGMAYVELGRLDDAERELTAARGLAPADPAVLLALARVRAAQGETDEANRLRDEARRLPPPAPGGPPPR